MSKLLSYSLLILLAVASTACGLIGPQAQPTMDPLVFQSTLNAAGTQAVETIAAQLTSTALAQPPTEIPTQAPTVVVLSPTTAPTSKATLVPTLAPTATATRVPVTSTPTSTSTPSDLVCTLVSQSPALGTKMSYGTDFDAVWKIKNTGTLAWAVGNVDIKYVSGEKMQKAGDTFDLAKTVNPGEEITITLDMLAPQNAGTYSAVWNLVAGRAFCNMNVKIEVTVP